MNDQTKIHSTVWQSAQPKARIHIVHGLAEHSGRYEKFADFLCSEGYTVTAHDQRGHGKTAEENGLPYGYIGADASFDLLVDDLFEVNQFYANQYSGLPVIIIGHSMGSFVVRRFIGLYGGSAEAAVLIGTGGNNKLESLAGRLLAAYRERKTERQPDHLLNDIIFGGFSKQFAGESSASWLSREKESVKAYEEDPACGFVPSSQIFRVLFEGVEALNNLELLENIPKDLPVLLLSGAADPVGNSGKGVFRTAEQLTAAGLEHVTVQLYEGGRHEVLQETNRQNVFQYIVRWIEKNV